MRRIFILIFFAAALVYVHKPAYAQAHILTIDLAQNHVDINTGFHGTYLQIFGVMEEPGDVAIIVEGPRRDMSVRHKEKISGAWINKSFETFEKVPSFYAYATSKPLAEMAGANVLNQYEIGTEYINLRPKSSTIESGQLKMFSQALIRNKKDQGIFASHSENIVFLTPRFFRTQIYMPANVPVGEYTVKSLYFHEGEMKESRANTLKVAQVGISADVYKFAHRKRFLYALMCIMIALFTGWASNKIGIRR